MVRMRDARPNTLAALLVWATCLALLSGRARAQEEPQRVPLPLSLQAGAPAQAALDVPLSLPGKQTVLVQAPAADWIRYGTLAFDIAWPADAPATAQVLVHVKDWDYFWYQNLLPARLLPGRTSRFEVSLLPGATGWSPRDHQGVWHHRALLEPKEVGISVFDDAARYSGTCRMGGVTARLRAPDPTPPAIRHVRVNATRVPCFERFEIAFDLPDRYANPFDPAQVSVQAEFEGPGGTDKVVVPGFYGQSYYRRVEATDERFFPQGPPFWRVRFAPGRRGTWRYTLSVRDAQGETRWGPQTFVAEAPRRPGFVRVSARDPRCFEFSNGSYFFPVGHNIRSPFDTRMDEQFPWTQRWPEGSAAYGRYFEAMQRHGETFAEVWSAAWSLGLEWSPQWRGYHGVGQYNLINAWEMDRVLEEAERRGIYLNYVVHNHGKFSTFCDPEWAGNPFNASNGGYLASPEQYWTDPRALQSFRNLMRYTIARWGYSPHIFAWELWSELNLAGTHAAFYRRPEVVAWHRQMGRDVRAMDPFGHMLSSHTSGDYTMQNPEIAALPEMDYIPVDAYHGNTDPLYIVQLMRATVEFARPFRKPVLITEFGGNPWAQDLKHLDDTLHAAIWAAVGQPMAGTPLFWWWQVIDEENFYPRYAALQRFMAGEDRRDPALDVHPAAVLLDGSGAPGFDVQCLKGPRRALGWIVNAATFSSVHPDADPPARGLTLYVAGFAPGTYEVEFWDTEAGRVVARRSLTTADGAVRAEMPPLLRDLAFKIRPR